MTPNRHPPRIPSHTATSQDSLMVHLSDPSGGAGAGSGPHRASATPPFGSAVSSSRHTVPSRVGLPSRNSRRRPASTASHFAEEIQQAAARGTAAGSGGGFAIAASLARVLPVQGVAELLQEVIALPAHPQPDGRLHRHGAAVPFTDDGGRGGHRLGNRRSGARSRQSSRFPPGVPFHHPPPHQVRRRPAGHGVIEQELPVGVRETPP